MATRMQQRRGTAQQWTDADPILAAGEIGFETDTNQFKIGDGVNHWDDLSYFKNLEDLGGNLDDYILLTEKATANGVATLDGTGNIPMSQLGNIIDGAPALLNTLNEIASAIDDDSSFANTVVAALSTKAPLASPNLTGIPTAPTPSSSTDSTQIATTAWVKDLGYETAATVAANQTSTDNSLSALDGRLTSVETSATVASGDIDALESDVSDLDSRVSTVEGLASSLDVAMAAAETDIDAAEANITNLQSDVVTAETNIGTLQSDVTAAEADIDSLQSSVTDLQVDLSAMDGVPARVTTAESDISTLQGDLDTAEGTLATVVSDLNTHEAATTSVHGIADTSALATKTYADTAGTNAVSSANTYTDTAVDLRAPKASPTFTGTVTIPAGASIAGFAPLASPALTGTPTAPTATAGTNNTQVATTAYADAAVAALVASAPSALNTLNELATALGNDASFSTTVTNSIATKAPIDSPTFTGTVTLPTGTVTSGMILDGTILNADINASAAIAQSKIANLTTDLSNKADKTASISSKSGAYTIASADVNSIIEFNSASGASFTIPSDNSFWPVGQRLEVLQVAAGQVTIAGAAGVTVNGTPTAKTRTTWSGATIIKRAANIFVVVGDLASS